MRFKNGLIILTVIILTLVSLMLTPRFLAEKITKNLEEIQRLNRGMR